MASSSSRVEITKPPGGGRSQIARLVPHHAGQQQQPFDDADGPGDRARGHRSSTQPLDGRQVRVLQLRAAAAPDVRDDDQRLGRLRRVDRQEPPWSHRSKPRDSRIRSIDRQS